MKKLINIIKNFGLYKEWKSLKRGKEPINLRRGAGYYFTTGLLFCNPIGKMQELEMKSGKTAIIKLISYKLFRDPDDMIKESFWHTSGYKGEKPFKKMSFEEYLPYFNTTS